MNGDEAFGFSGWRALVVLEDVIGDYLLFVFVFTTLPFLLTARNAFLANNYSDANDVPNSASYVLMFLLLIQQLPP